MLQPRARAGRYHLSPPPSFSPILSGGGGGQCSIAYHEPYLRLIERLLPIMPHPSLDSFFFVSSGSEAVEAALKMVRSIRRRERISTCPCTRLKHWSAAALLTLGWQ
jgi:acetylornithine/succinyldiaminopimelate/putrescine aminotransferase